MSGIDWEKSSALTLLKRDFLRGFFRRNRHFFLTGGSALGIFFLEHRKSYDLDFFSTQDIDWHRLTNDVLDVSREIGAQTRSIQTSPTFARFRAVRGDDVEVLDFVREFAPQVNPQKIEIGGIIVDSMEEIAVNKWCSLLGRCEAKDVIDLYFLSKRCDIRMLFAKASDKEGGMEPSVLSYVISQLKLDELPDNLLAPVTLDELNSFLDDVREFLDSQSFPESSRDPEKDRY